MQGQILTADFDGVIYIKLKGVIRYSQCAGLEAFIDNLFESPAFNSVAIDLENAEMLDSTALGLLAKISIELRKITQQKATLFIQNGELLHILKRVCFDQVFKIVPVKSHQENIDFVEIKNLKQSEQEVLSSVLAAHESLAELSESNRSLYTDITEALKIS